MRNNKTSTAAVVGDWMQADLTKKQEKG